MWRLIFGLLALTFAVGTGAGIWRMVERHNEYEETVTFGSVLQQKIHAEHPGIIFEQRRGPDGYDSSVENPRVHRASTPALFMLAMDIEKQEPISAYISLTGGNNNVVRIIYETWMRGSKDTFIHHTELYKPPGSDTHKSWSVSENSLTITGAVFRYDNTRATTILSSLIAFFGAAFACIFLRSSLIGLRKQPSTTDNA